MGAEMYDLPPGMKFSFSKLESFRHCPMMFKLEYCDHVAQEENAFALYGSFAHKLIELYCKGEIPDFALAEEYKNNYDDAVTRPWPPFPKGMPQKYYEQGLQYFENFSGFGDNFEILSVEEKFELDIGGYPFVGIADLVLRDKTTGEITVIDHKSKSSSTMAKDLPTYRKQLYIYAAYVKQRWGVWPKYLKFNLFRENEWVTEEFDEATYNQVIQWVIDTIEAILSETEWKVSPNSYFCRFVCGCSGSCPARDVIMYPPPKKEKPPDEKQS